MQKKRDQRLASAREELQAQIQERQQIEQILRRRLRFEETLVRISSRFAQVTDMGKAISASLEDMGRLAGAGRAYLFLFREGGAIMDNTHEWCQEGVSPQIENLQGLRSEDFPWWIQQLRSGRAIHIPNVSQLPPEAEAERAVLKQQGIQSLMVLPIHVHRELAGFIGLDNVECPGEWGEDELNLLRISAEIIGSSLERERTAQELRQSEEHFRSLTENASDLITVLDAEGRVLYQSPSVERILGYASWENRECNVFTRMHPDDRATVRAFLDELLENPGEIRTAEFRYQHQDGTWLYLETIGKRLPDDTSGRRRIVATSRDTTVRRKIQARVEEQERLAAIGQLAAGIAHDFNNILTGIMGYAEIIQMESGAVGNIREYADLIVQQSWHAAQLIRQILDFSRTSLIERKPFDLFTFLQEAVQLLKRTIPENIQINLACEPGCYTIEGDRVQVQQALTNLVINARDAMPDGGRLTIGLARKTIAPRDRMLFERVGPGEWIVLSVSDTGMGIPADVLPRIYEPFFTTKETSRGTGLGLAQVYGIISQHEGVIDVHSEVGVGTTFRIYLPPSEHVH